MSRLISRSSGFKLLLLAAVLTPALVAQSSPRRPLGIYAVVNVEDNINPRENRRERHY